ncbi:uncharacterized protein [Anabrus simplex]|uniref:uncharacterized protein n=1 Tax=Anabrus simplex TaxID=316456 RepID=UPI0034DD4602
MQSVLVASLLGASVVLNSLVTANQLSDTHMPAERAETEDMDSTQAVDLDLLASYLTQALRDDGWDEEGGPLLYVEDLREETHMPLKRSRYYRRYPWKRQNGIDRIIPVDDFGYMCNPSREDVFKLLVALHEARAGNHGRTVSFCNVKRPASTIFTNIRFLGKRRK